MSTATCVPGHIKMPKIVTGARANSSRYSSPFRVRRASASAASAWKFGGLSGRRHGGRMLQQRAQLARHRAAEQLVAALVRHEQHGAPGGPRIVEEPRLELALAAARERRRTPRG